ncbi:OmpA family protein [Flavobacterium olei]|uniref:OmpA family protein n=1 Tax=Flavobacterium olei TaxID=1886782 RepID=UPI003219DC5C
MTCKGLYISFVFLLISILGNSLYAQNKKLQKANNLYDKLAFAEAGKLYQELVDSGNTSTEVYTKLGDSYYYNAEYAKAAQSYSKLMEASANNVPPEYYFRYAQALNSTGKRSEAAAVMRTYYAKNQKNDLNENWVPEKFHNQMKLQSGRYTIVPVGINSPFSDFGTAFNGEDKIIYASAKDTGIIIKRIHKWTDKSFLKLYTADVTSNGELQNSKKLKGEINTKYHQSTPAITKDGKTMFFTRNNYTDGKLKRDNVSKISYLKIYTASNVDGVWKNIKELPVPVNSENFSSAHPALSPDETELYFVSDRNNKFGNSDLYVVNLNHDRTIGNNLRKLGDEINTLGGETFPFIDDSNILYFSSDGHPGLGGLDVFAAKKDKNGVYQIVNLGDGVNSENDDFAYVINNRAKKGYFSSNRGGNDDIYGFTENSPPLFKSDEPEQIAINEPYIEDLTATLKLEPIYFDFNGFKIRESSKTELNKVIQLMNDRPQIVVKVNAHTDCRGKDDFNLLLSEKRAKSTVNYIINGGIDANRISGEGYGETRIINKCKNGVQCTEQEHQLNRRSEFIIVKDK